MASSNALEFLCIVLLGLGQMCIMTGYDTQSFVVESVLHSVNGREPTRIDAYAGYYGVLFWSWSVPNIAFDQKIHRTKFSNCLVNRLLMD
ncbi:hypothetical protein ANCCEY_00272 [Ancylostoma ceylanicum]|uniref:Major facilitator superfamily (MFS) profile domain-containing protein n=1 Tax=Ancylostoma ceylanicum TaxID=53326 RepID=A0A0D6M963_9BILA|nr:hypothetical protein ANCCEY_00272 [Ancylostoma ceylanicum]